jgi:hypothetical protein
LILTSKEKKKTFGCGLRNGYLFAVLDHFLNILNPLNLLLAVLFIPRFIRMAENGFAATFIEYVILLAFGITSEIVTRKLIVFTRM